MMLNISSAGERMKEIMLKRRSEEEEVLSSVPYLSLPP